MKSSQPSDNSRHPELLLVFPPQWSPFQPPLSLPSISAWLRREGYSTGSLDANVQFYHWLLSERGAEAVLENSSLHRSSKVQTATAIVSSWQSFRESVSLMWDSDSPTSLTSRHYVAFRSFETYLDAVSQLSEGSFVVSPYELKVKRAVKSAANIESLVSDPPAVLKAYNDYLISRIVNTRPRSVGLSCIGQEQLFFSLLIGKSIKEHLANVPVFVGGTVLPRIHERHGLPAHWFTKYFDAIVKNEGEKPAVRLLDALRLGESDFSTVEGVVALSPKGLTDNPSAAPLRPAEIPAPDFDDLDLQNYFSPVPTLPLLSSRGCYWGKCQFCHHGMVYGDGYSANSLDAIETTIEHLADRYGIRHFAFNDEAIPPKVLRGLGRKLRSSDETGFQFTGLIKFEKFYTKKDFFNARRIGFRSLYVGLESASERVLDLMQKPNSLETIERNLSEAKLADIWMHCFVFFGFPGETHQDARLTHDFLLRNSDIVGSFGAGVFELEHNSPIYFNNDGYGIELESEHEDSLSVYYNYQVDHGVSSQEAHEYVSALYDATTRISKYQAVQWIPREHLLSLLESTTSDRIVREYIDLYWNIPIRQSCLLTEDGTLIFKPTGGAAKVDKGTVHLVAALLQSRASCGDVRDVSPDVASLILGDFGG